MDSVLTLIAPPQASILDAATAARARTAMDALGAETGQAVWLSANEACDIAFSGLAIEQAEAAVRETLGEVLDTPGIDIISQPLDGRRKKLLIADMDSTIVTGETLDELAAFAGLKDRIAAITKRAMNGEIGFSEALFERVGMLSGLEEKCLEETLKTMTVSPGAEALVRTMRAHGAYTALISGGFTYFTERISATVGFHEHLGNHLEITGGKLTGRVIEPIVDKETKLKTLLALAGKKHIPTVETLSVGDGANDLPMLLSAGLGVAYHAKPAVAAGARHRIDHGDLTALLFAQGYARDEFVTA